MLFRLVMVALALLICAASAGPKPSSSPQPQAQPQPTPVMPTWPPPDTKPIPVREEKVTTPQPAYTDPAPAPEPAAEPAAPPNVPPDAGKRWWCTAALDENGAITDMAGCRRTLSECLDVIINTPTHLGWTQCRRQDRVACFKHKHLLSGTTRVDCAPSFAACNVGRRWILGKSQDYRVLSGCTNEN